MKLTTLKPRLATIPGRLQLATTLQTQRLRGRAAVERRAEYLQQHPLCQECQAHAQDLDATVAAVVDHRIPLWAGGSDDYASNGNALCTPHHDAKTACEARMRAAGGWLVTPCTCGQHPNA